jgi:uncharacterized protein
MNHLLTDVNVNLSRWPFRRLPLDETPALVKKLKSHHVRQAWAGSFDGVLHKDLAGVNARLAQHCREHGPGLLVPFGAVNPRLPDWEEDLHRCHEDHQMPGIRIYPGYHGYKLDEPLFARLLHAATQRRLIVQLVVMMEDRRTQHPLVQVPPVDLNPLPALLREFPGLPLVLLNAFQPFQHDLILKIAAAGRVYFEPATLEGAGGVGNLLEKLPVSRLLFGSHAPLFYFEAALLKLQESALDETTLRAVCHDNAHELLPRI